MRARTAARLSQIVVAGRDVAHVSTATVTCRPVVPSRRYEKYVGVVRGADTAVVEHRRRRLRPARGAPAAARSSAGAPSRGAPFDLRTEPRDERLEVAAPNS